MAPDELAENGTEARADSRSAGDDRAHILAELRQRIQDAGGGPVTVVGTRLAETLGIPIQAFRAQLAALVTEGLLVKLASGLAGTKLALPGPAATAVQSPPDAPTPVPSLAAAANRPDVQPGEDTTNGREVAPSNGRIPLRDRVRQHLESAIRTGGGEVVTSTPRIADAVGASTNAVAYHLQALVILGHIATERAGPRGTRIRLGASRQHPATTSEARSARAHGFCPNCGAKVAAAGWRFCQTCGKRLPT